MSFMKAPGHPDAGSPTADMRFKGGGGGGQTTTKETTTKSEPWDKQKPFLEYGFEQAKNLYEGGTPEYFPGDTVSGFNPLQNLAQGAGASRAISGSPLLRAGQDETLSTLRGDYLNAGNPHLDGVMENIKATVLPSVNSRFAGAGRLHSGLAADAAARAVTQSLAPYAFNNYEAERGRMQNAARMSPSMADADYNDINALANIGHQQQTQTQAELNADIARHNYNTNLDANKLAQYMGLVQGSYGGTQSGTSTATGPAPSGGKGGGVGSVLGGAGSFMRGVGSL